MTAYFITVINGFFPFVDVYVSGTESVDKYNLFPIQFKWERERVIFYGAMTSDVNLFLRSTRSLHIRFPT